MEATNLVGWVRRGGLGLGGSFGLLGRHGEFWVGFISLRELVSCFELEDRMFDEFGRLNRYRLQMDYCEGKIVGCVGK